MIQHVVLMKFKPNTTPKDVQELENALGKLPDRITEIKAYAFGRDVVRSERSYDFALVSLIADLDALERYQKHPEHLKVGQVIRNLCENIIAVDFEYNDAAPL